MQTRERERERERNFASPLTFNINANPSQNLANSTLAKANSTPTILLAQNEIQAQGSENQATSNQNQNSNTEFQATSNQNQASSTEIQSYELEETTIEAHAHDTQKYSSGSSLGKSQLEGSPSGNGDIGSALKVLPNVQFDNTQLKSTTPGEIDAANISISGGLFYQNNIQIDGFNANNDLTSNIPNDITSGTSKGARSQSFNIDTSLLESIVVQDSNIGAAYGGFTGGVVEANIRRPKKDGKWHTDFSYQMTQGNAKPGKFSLTRYHIHEDVEEIFLNSASENYQPEFIKHIIRANFEGYFTEKFGILGSFNTTQSYIPVYAASPLTHTVGTNAGSKKTQRRQSYTYYLKAFYNPTDTLALEASLGYSPQSNSYFITTDGGGSSPNSDYTYDSEAWQGGLKAIYSSSLGILTTQFGYIFNQSKLNADPRYTYYANWFISDGANWARQSASSAIVYNAPNWGNTFQKSSTPTLKSDFAFEPVKAWISTHNFRVGVEFSNTSAVRERLTPYVNFVNDNSIPVPSTEPCPTTPDNLGFMVCVDGKPYQNPNEAIRSGTTTYQKYTENSTNQQVKDTHSGNNSWANGYDTAVAQYYNIITYFQGPNKIKLDNFAYAVFVEDDINFNLGNFGDINTRLGLRFDGDNYMDKNSLAPRFALSYVTPFKNEFQTQLTFGANRYYGRNLLSYRILDYKNIRRSFQRDCVSCDWVEIPLNLAKNSPWTSSVAFSELKIPYSDELMGAISQNLGPFNATLKYIHRNGHDEIVRVSAKQLNLGSQEGYSSSYSVWSNEGRSKSQILSFSLENLQPITTFGVSHHYFFAFDYTKVKRAYKIYASSTDDDAYLDSDVIYDDKLIKYSDRPVDNFVRPYTLRFSTLHATKLGRTKWLWNNFFRYRSPFEKMVAYGVNNNNTTFKEWAAIYPSITRVYNKKRFAGAFTWDMRVGFEMDVYMGNTFYMNFDILNVLNKANETTLINLQGNVGYDTLSTSTVNSVTSYEYSSYEVGRQFWIQVGYKY